MVRNYLFVIFSILLILPSCVDKPVVLKKEKATNALNVKYAEYYKVEYADSFTMLTILNPWKSKEILQQYKFQLNGTPTKTTINLPLKRLSVHSLDNIGFLSELSGLDRICAITDANRVFSGVVRNRISQGKIIDLGPAIDFNIEKLLQSKPDLILSTTFDNADKSKLILEKSEIPILFNLGWMEKTPLGRAEWIKVIGLIIGREQAADSIFKQVEKSYLNLKELTKNVADKPKVMVGAGYNGIWYMPGGQSFKAILLRDAGADYHWSSNESSGSLALNFETVLTNHLDDDFWIEAPWKSLKEMKMADGRYLNFKSVNQQRVFNNFGLSDKLSNDYWETGICRPDFILMDLIEIFHPNLTTHNLIYYKRL